MWLTFLLGNLYFIYIYIYIRNIKHCLDAYWEGNFSVQVEYVHSAAKCLQKEKFVERLFLLLKTCYAVYC